MAYYTCFYSRRKVITRLLKIALPSLMIVALVNSCSTESHRWSDHSPEGASERRAAAAEDNGYTVLSLDEAFSVHSYNEIVEDFLSRQSGSREITKLIMEETRRHNLPISLTFSLAWGESRFNPFAVNWNESSVDRGLFQLNNRSFPELQEDQFFDPVLNTKNGVAYLKYCLERGESEVTALAMYNAGPRRISERGAPKMTLDYIDKIITYRQELDDDFQAELRDMLAINPEIKNGKKVSLIVDRAPAYQ